ncbi:hypothetical protein [Natronobiforma cellulositropha]|uniref:hypothetical protein n=1 Tax=Natronobiforma cellulositropha TaxID=1679076 RepID=UPI0021D5D654|nr:hypothetical protein [Natronobiforma cellulositropha]
MSTEDLHVEFVYPSGDDEEWHRLHWEALERAAAFELVGGRIVETERTDHVHVVSSPDLHELWPYDAGGSMRHTKDDGDVIDLTTCPVVSYEFADLRFLLGNDEYPPPGTDREIVTEILELVTLGYEATDEPPYVAYSITPDMPYIGRPPITAASLANAELTHLCWLTVFTPPLVETYGRETLLSAPAWHVEELEDGAIILVCHDDPTWETSLQPVADHIGLPAPEEIRTEERW